VIESETTKKIVSNTVYQLVGKLTTMAITVFATILITRIYGREGYGEFSLMQSWPALFFIIVDFGINAIATRDLSKDFSKAGTYLGNILLMRVFFSIFLISILFFVLSFFPYSESLIFGIRLSLFLILTQALFSSTNIIFQTKLKYNYSTVSLISGYLLVFAVIIGVSYFKLPVMWISFGYVLGGLITFVVGLKFLKKLDVKLSFNVDLRLWKHLFITTLPLGVMFIFSQMSFKEDELLLSFLKLPKSYGLSNTESVAIYSLPYRVFEVALVIPTFFMNSTYPIMIQRMVEGKEKLIDIFYKSIRILLIAGVVAGLALMIVSPLIIKILGGSQFVQSVSVLQVLAVGLVFYYITQPLSWLIVTLDKQIYLPFIYFGVAGVNLILNLYFIPVYSFYGAAAITGISEILILILLIFAVKKAWKCKYDDF